VKYRVESEDNRWDWRRLADEILRHPQALCVLNLRRQAFAAWEAVRQRLAEKPPFQEWQEAVFHLSSAMCPAHRLDLLGLSRISPPNNITARLKSGKPCWVLSTQLIEAGVDVDFPIVFRAMGPLDSIVQSGGRCNREGLLADAMGGSLLGEVVVFHPEEGGIPPGIYEKATAITPPYLIDPERLAIDPHVFTSYFTELYQITPTDHARKGQNTIQEDRAEFNFQTVAKNARVIQQDTISVIVPYGRAKNVVAKIRKTRRFDRKTLRRLQRYMVSLRRGPGSDFEKLTGLGALEPLLSGSLDIPVLDGRCYDPQRGIVIRDRSPEDFVV
jgi:CRISPR-associated endonuclease/helicase Cas3